VGNARNASMGVRCLRSSAAEVHCRVWLLSGGARDAGSTPLERVRRIGVLAAEPSRRFGAPICVSLAGSRAEFIATWIASCAPG